MNIKEMDQTNWVCYQFQGNSYYYGQVAYLDQTGQIHPKDTVEMATNPKARLVKHGFGIYLYNVKGDSYESKYEGKWQKDKKHGLGSLRFSNKNIYQGQFKDNAFHDHGKMEWFNGSVYQGQWKKGRMDGQGIFKHIEGYTLKGNFKSNHYIDETVLRNPFMSQKQYQIYKKQCKETIKQRQKNQKIKHGYLQKIQSNLTDKIIQKIQQSTKNNRITFLLSSQQNNVFNLKSLLKIFEQKNKQYRIFDLRKSYQLNPKQKYQYKKSLKGIMSQILTKGLILIINLDQTQIQYQEIFYPDMRQFYDQQAFSQQFWSRNQMARHQVKSKIIGDSNINQDYRVIVWSKVKLSQSLNQSKLKQKLQKRFQSVIPFIKIDIVFLIKQKPDQGPKQ